MWVAYVIALVVAATAAVLVPGAPGRGDIDLFARGMAIVSVAIAGAVAIISRIDKSKERARSEQLRQPIVRILGSRTPHGRQYQLAIEIENQDYAAVELKYVAIEHPDLVMLQPVPPQAGIFTLEETPGVNMQRREASYRNTRIDKSKATSLSLVADYPEVAPLTAASQILLRFSFRFLDYDATTFDIRRNAEDTGFLVRK